MKPNPINVCLLITFISLPILIQAQISGSIKLTQNELIIQKNAEFDELLVKKFRFTDEIGSPQLPVCVESFVVPYEAIVTGISINSVIKKKIEGEFYIYPTQPPRPLDGSEPPEFVEPNTAVYNSISPYPGKVAEIISDGYTHGYHIVTIILYPVEYIPKNKEIYLCEIDFTINYTSPKLKRSDIIYPEKQSIKRALLAENYIKSFIKNVNDIEDFKNKNVNIIQESNILNISESSEEPMMQTKSTSIIQELVPDYIIITNEELKPTFQVLADWKTKKGFPTIIKTIEEIEPNYPGSDLPEKIRNYLKEAYSKWLDLFVLIGGDVNIVPARYVPRDDRPETPTDLYYATYEGTWNLDNDNIYGEDDDDIDDTYDFFLGRASVEDITEAQIFVNKVIAYEKYSNLGSSTYVNNNLYLTGFMDENDCGVYINNFSNYIKDYAETYIPGNINNWFLLDNYDCLFDYQDPYNTPFNYHSGFRDPHCNVTSYLNESFEDNIDPTDDLPQGWEKEDNYWVRIHPTDIDEHHRYMVMKFRSSDIGSGNSSCLISPSINVPDNQDWKFSIYRDNLNSLNDKIIFEYEKDGNGNWIKLGEITRYHGSSSSNNWFEFDHGMPQGNIKIRLKGVSDGGSDIYIDHICIAEKFIKRPGGLCVSGNNTLNKSNATACLNNGGSSGLGNFHIVYHMQHSAETGMGISQVTDESFRNDNFDALLNGNFQQILFSNGCKTATFSKDCIGEHYINNSQGGGVAFIGNADRGFYPEHTQFGRFVDALYTTTNHPSTGYNLGLIFQQAPDPTMASYKNQKKTLTLLGDPLMPVWTNTPQTLNVSVYPTYIECGENSITVTINNLPTGEEALICLKKDDEDYATRTVTSNGSYIFNFTPQTFGHIDVTVTAHNFKPFENIILVGINQNQNIYISDLVFDDDKTGSSYGNNDQQNDAGETIELSIELKNNGLENAFNVSATLGCSSPYVSISSNHSNFGMIAAGSTKSSLSNYIFTIDKDAPEILTNDLNPVKLSLFITDDESNIYTDNFNIDVFSPEIEQANKTIISTSDGDEIIEPNETVTINIDLFNKGKAQATGITGTLSANNSYITSCSATPRNYPDIDKYSTKTNTSVYQFSVNSSYSVGQPLDFILQVENEYGKTWLPPFNFDLLDKPDISQIQPIEFIADQTEIELSWTPINDIGGYNIYRCDADANGNELGNYAKVNTFIVQSAYYKDFDLNESTIYFYKVSAISLTGNESDLSPKKEAWTSYPLKDSFPVEMNVGNSIISSINVMDINYDGLKEIFTGIHYDDKNGYLIGLNNDGTELFDIDDNPETYSGFAKLDASINSTPAIGDIKANGNFSVISMTRDGSADKTNYFSCHSNNDNNSDGKPDLLWQHTISSPCYRAPIVTNLDNSSDASLESIFYTEWGGIRIYNDEGQLWYSFADDIGGTYGSLAIADLDCDGDKEIIGCYRSLSTGITGIYIWHHNGSNYGVNQPFYTLSGYYFGSSVVVCNIDNYGDKEILTSALEIGSNEGRIVAIHHDGSVVNGWNGTQTISYPSELLSQDISVGDLNNDGNLEVVAIGTDVVKVWDKSGTPISSTAINNLAPGKLNPILADVDNDTDVEIIFGSNEVSEIYALNMDGTKVFGFPLHIDDALYGSPCIADVDNNGKNEIIAGSGNKIYMWETNGNSELIEWGSERHNCHNTGEYSEICPPVIINSNTTWNSNQDLCGDIIIKSGILTIASSCTVSMAEFSKVLIMAGGELNIDGGKIINCHIKALDGSNVTLNNNGSIKINNSREFTIDTGATFDHQYGTIEIAH
jgi:hypothetical protein